MDNENYYSGFAWLGARKDLKNSPELSPYSSLTEFISITAQRNLSYCTYRLMSSGSLSGQSYPISQ